jgi:hypothetical protein
MLAARKEASMRAWKRVMIAVLLGALAVILLTGNF